MKKLRDLTQQEPKEWYHNGLLHREDGPAVEYPDGTREWYRNGLLHRDGGPAVERPDGTDEWYQNDRLHRENGPAVERFLGGYKGWYLGGVKYDISSVEELQEKLKEYIAKEIHNS